MNKVLFVVGPTATGKTDLSLHISRTIPSVLINADSVQVYKQLNILSGKDLPEHAVFKNIQNQDSEHLKKFDIGYYLYGETPVYLLDIVPPSYSFNVSDYFSCASFIVKYIQSQNLLPIIVGNTGYYIKAFLDGIKTISIPPNKILRESLKQKSTEELAGQLEEVDRQKFNTMNNSDRNNKRRLIRAIEIASYTGELTPISHCGLQDMDSFMIGLLMPPSEMKKKIATRVDKWFENESAVEEARMLYKEYSSLSEQVKNAVGYKQMFEHFEKNTLLSDTTESIKHAQLRLVKRQLTWFRADKRVKWFDSSIPSFYSSIHSQVQEWYNKK